MENADTTYDPAAFRAVTIEEDDGNEADGEDSDDPSEGNRPARILIAAVAGSWEHDEVENQQSEKHQRASVAPSDPPEEIRSRVHHQLDVFRELVVAWK